MSQAWVSISVPDFQTPYIVDDSFDPSTIIGEHFVDQFQNGLEAKSGPFLSMSAYEKSGQREMLEYHTSNALHQPHVYATYAPPYTAHPLLYSGLNNHGQDTDYDYLEPPQYARPQALENDSNGMMPQHVRHLSASHIYNVHNNNPISMSENPRKRKASSVSEYDVMPPQKRPSIAQLQVQDPNGDYYDLSAQASPYSTLVPTPTGSVGLPQYPTTTASPRPSGHQYSTSTASQASLAAPSPHTPAWSPSFTTVKTEHSPRAPMTPIPRPASASPLKSSIPKLVRTSTIQQSPPGLTSTMVSMHAQSFNPYAMYPLKASLKLRGDLDSMTKDWDGDECEARRRLVEFTRTQTASTITAEFKPVAPQDRAPSSITISCIWWKERNEYFVTSVDTIYLLESLVGVRFTVEEKNRIRRNLEGFRPLTVSKSKLDSEDFFKVIMGFPHPKPRNIEKDVKVFPWKILSHALKKIISKYSASYSSTASALLTPTASAYASTEASAEFTFPPSPHPEMITTVGPHPVMTAMVYPPGQIPGRMSAPVTTGPLPELQLQMPTVGPPPYEMPGPYGFVSMPPMHESSMEMATQTMTAPPLVRMPSSWDFTHFVNDSPITVAPSSAPPGMYPRGGIDTAEFITPPHYQMR